MAGRRLAVLFAVAENADENLADLPFAVERTRRLASALERYGYDCRVQVNLKAHQIEEAVREIIATADPGDFVIVHVLGYGWLGRTGDITAVGSDGLLTGQALWLDPAPTAAGAEILFLFDLTRVTTSAPSNDHGSLTRRAQHLGAITESKVFHGQFTSAVAEALDELSGDDPDIDPPLAYFPLPVVASAVRRRADPSQIDEFWIESDTPFFPNPRFVPAAKPLDERAWSVSVVELDGATAFVVGTSAGAVLYSVDGAPISRVTTSAAILSVAAIPGMSAVLSGGADGRVTIRSLPDLSVRTQLDGHRARVDDVTAANVGGRVLAASTGDDGTVRWCELGPTIRLLHVVTTGPGLVYPLTFTDGTQPLLIGGTEKGMLVAWDPDTGNEIWRTPPTSRLSGIVSGVVEDRPSLVCVTLDGSVMVWDLRTQRLTKTLPGLGLLRCVALQGDGRTAVVGGDRGQIAVVDLSAGTVGQSVDLDAGMIWSVALYESADGPAVAAATDRGLRTTPLAPAPPPPRSYAGFVADVATGADQLGITGEVNTLCDLVLAKEITPPLSIGLFGDWGTGKSFFMGKMRDRIGVLATESRTAGMEGHESALCSHVCQIEFNAWHYIDVDLWASLAATVFDRLAAADASTVSRAVLEDLPSMRLLREGLVRKRKQTRDLLDNVNEELKQESPIGVRDVLTTENVQNVAGQAAKEVKTALVALGVPEDKAAEVDLREVADTTGTLWKNLQYVFRRTKWPLRLLIFLGAVAAIAGPPVLGALLGDSLTSLTAALASYAIYGVSAFAFGKPYLDRTGRAVSAVKDLVSSIDDRRRAPVEARRDTLRQRMVDIDQEIIGLETRIQDLRRGNSISAFAIERTEADHYRRHEGVVATLRRDLEEMSRRLTATKTHGQSSDLERIILYIDDLDRCPPRRVVEVLQAIHLLLAFPLFVVVVGVDSRWLLRSLDMFLRENGDDDTRTASTPQNYLEKIFQISQCLRPMSPTGYADLISANVGALEPEPRPQPVAAAPATPTPSTEVAAPQQTVPAETPAPPTRRVARPSVIAREVRSYRDSAKIAYLCFDSTATRLDSLDRTGVLTRRYLTGSDPHEETSRLVENDLNLENPVVPVPGGRLLWLGSPDMLLIEPESGDRREIKPPNGRFGQAVVSSSTGEAILQEPRGWYLHDLTSESTGTKLDAPPLAFSRSWRVDRQAGGRHVLVVGRTGTTERQLEIASPATAVGIDPSERWILLLNDAHRLHLHDLTGADATTVQLAENVTLAEFGPNGLLAAASSSTVSVWDCETRGLRAEIPADDKTTAITFSPDGRRLATGDVNGLIKIWVIRDDKPAVDLSAGALRLTSAEREMIVAVRPFIETPRSAKRLINTYRLLRAALTEADLVALRSGGHKPVLLLLSVLLGEPEEATEVMRELLGDRPLPPAFTALIRRRTAVRPDARQENRRVAGRRRASAPDGLEAKVTEIIKATGTTDDAAEYRRWAGVVARYSFRTLDL